MPNIKSAKKRVRVIETKTLRNKMCKSDLRTAIKKANISLDNNASDKSEAVTNAIKKIDMAVSKGIMHKNTASRKKSTLAKKLNQAF